MIVSRCVAPEGVPDGVRARWREAAIAGLIRYERALAAATQTLDALEISGIPGVVLRGLSLAQGTYPDPLLRPMADVDILVPRRSRFVMVERLRRQGLSPCLTRRSQFLYDVAGALVEVHWSLLTPRRYRAIADFDLWLDTRTVVHTEKGRIFRLSRENELIEIVMHAFVHHELDTLLKLVDIALVSRTPEFDWDYVIDWCRRYSTSRMFAVTLGLIQHLFGLSFDGHSRLVAPNLPRGADRIFAAYAARYFDAESRAHMWRRKKALLFAAETKPRRLKQLLRLASPDHIVELSRGRPRRGPGSRRSSRPFVPTDEQADGDRTRE